MHGLEPVACVRQGTLGDGRKGVAQIPLFKRLLEIDNAVIVWRWKGIGVGHAWLSSWERIRSRV